MPKFKYVGKDSNGAKVEETIEAPNQNSARQMLKRSGVTVLTISEVKKSIFNLSFGQPRARASTSDLVIFTRQFSTMVEAGLPVVEILDILTEQTDDPGFKLAVGDIRASVRAGSDLSTAMAKYPKVFAPVYINLIRAGEASGDLDVILKRLASFLEKNASLKRKIISAMTYPSVSLTLIILITVGLLVFIVPQFQDIFSKLGAQLPLPTVVVITISDTLINNWHLVLGAVGALVGLIVFAKRTAGGRLLLDKLKIKSPVVGELFKKVSISRFSRTFSTMLKSGVPMLGSLEIVAGTAGNAVVEAAVMEAREAVRHGETLAAPLSECPVFPPMVVRMISVGERTGALEALLEKVADFYDEQVDSAVESMTSIIEPVMIGIMGILVGGIVIALFLPILELQNQI
ncbi:MAG: type II secretion system F family protein [Planctomycetota bacterium]|nr:type II secretion system F family protein [Planctomycetota bacterium]